MEIRELTSSDATSYHRVRIQALSEWPPAFGSPVEDETGKSLEEVERFLTGTKNRKLFGAFVGSILIGSIRYSRYSGANEGHRAYVAGFFVDPAYRRQGAGRALLKRAIDEANTDHMIRRINLTVVSDQSFAIRLYESLGFVECGIDYEAFSARGQFFDEYLMTKQVKSGRGAC